jgi:putative DNA primase/helicase
VQTFAAVIVEHDAGTMGFDVMKQALLTAGLAFVAYTSWSHTEAKPRWRVIVPLSKGHLAGEHLRFVEELNAMLGGALSVESGNLSQAWFIGHRADAADFKAVHHLDGRPLDQLTGLPRRPLEKTNTAAPLRREPSRQGTAQDATQASIEQLLRSRPAGLPNETGFNDNAGANWFEFDQLTSAEKNALIREILELPEIIAIADAKRDEGWRNLFFAVADAYHRGADQGYELCLAWSQTSQRFDQRDFDRSWRNFRADRPDGITVGTLFQIARQVAGYDADAGIAQLIAGRPGAQGGTGTDAGGTGGHGTGAGNGTGTGTGGNGAGNGTGTQGNAGPGPSAQGWGLPQPLPITLLPVPLFDPAWLPNLIRLFCLDVAHSMPCPLDYVVVNVLTALAGVLGNRLLIEAKTNNSWLVAPNFWGLVVGDVAQKKSPAARPIAQILMRLQNRETQRYDAKMAAWANTKAIHQALTTQHQSILNAAAKQALKAGSTAMPGGLPSVPQLPLEPQLRHLFTNDTTYEKLSELCVTNRDGIIAMGDELAGQIAALNREDMRMARQFYLIGWNGDLPYKMDRIVRGTNTLDHFAITVLGNIQPDPLAQVLLQSADPGQMNDGFAQRFSLLVWPDPVAGVYTDTVRPHGVMQQINAAFDAFAELNPSQVKGTDNNFGHWEWFVRLDQAALARFIDWHDNEYLPLCADLTQAASLRAHFTKYPKLALGLALVIHLLDLVQLLPNQPVGDPQGVIPAVTPIHLAALDQAIAITRYAAAHARRAYHASADPAYVSARLLAQRIAKGELVGTTRARLIVQRGWSGLRVVQQVLDGLTVLEEFGWVRCRHPHGFKPQGGRPPGADWEVNPSAMGIKVS